MALSQGRPARLAAPGPGHSHGISEHMEACRGYKDSDGWKRLASPENHARHLLENRLAYKDTRKHLRRKSSILDPVFDGSCRQTLDMSRRHMLTRSGQHLAAGSDVCRATQVCEELGVLMVTDPVNCNCGSVHLQGYIFDIVV